MAPCWGWTSSTIFEARFSTGPVLAFSQKRGGRGISPAPLRVSAPAAAVPRQGPSVRSLTKKPLDLPGKTWLIKGEQTGQGWHGRADPGRRRSSAWGFLSWSRWRSSFPGCWRCAASPGCWTASAGDKRAGKPPPRLRLTLRRALACKDSGAMRCHRPLSVTDRPRARYRCLRWRHGRRRTTWWRSCRRYPRAASDTCR